MKMKRFLSAVLTVAMLMSMIVLPVSAEETAETISTEEIVEIVPVEETTAPTSEVKTEEIVVEAEVAQTTEESAQPITLDEPFAVSLAQEESAPFTFTPAESGRYILHGINGERLAPNIMNIETGNGVAYDYWYHNDTNETGCAFNLEAGVAYQITLHNWSDMSVIDTTLTLTKTTNYETFYLECDSNVAYVDGYANFYVKGTPMFAGEEITWTVSDETILPNFYGEGGWGNAQCAATGTVTVTATTASGLSDSCTITVKEVEKIALDQSFDVILEPDASLKYSFTPAEDGRYILYGAQSEYMNMEVRNATTNKYVQGDSWSDNNGMNGMAFDLIGGNEYTVTLRHWRDYTISTALTMTKAVNYDYIEMFQNSVTAYVGADFDLAVDQGPTFGSEKINWTVADESIVELDYSHSNFAWFIPKAVGTTTVTATTANSGLSTTCTVTVTEMPTVEGDSFDVSLPADGEVACLYTPAEDGTYLFYFGRDTWNIGFTVYAQETGEWIDRGDWENMNTGNHGNSFALTGGITYRIIVDNHDSVDRYETVSIAKAVPFETMQIKGSSICYVGSYANLYLSGTPDFAMETVTWTNSNPEVAAVQWSGGTFIDLVGCSVGTTTITATTVSGMTATFELTVKEMETITGNSFDVTIPAEGNAQYLFTPAEDGSYLFYLPNDVWSIGFEIRNQETDNWVSSGDWENPNSGNHGVVFELSKDVTYLVAVYNWRTYQQSFTVSLAKTVPYDTMWIEGNNTCFIDSDVYLRIYGEPMFAAESVQWTVSNPDVVQVRHSSSTGISLLGIAVGSTTVTATTESGKTASFELTVKETPTLGMESMQVVLPAGESVAYTFTPAESGNYIFYRPMNQNYGIEVRHPQYGYMDSGEWYSDDDTYCGSAVALTAGEQYLIQLNNWRESEQTVTVAVANAVPYEHIAFRNAPLGFVGETAYVLVAGGPGFAYEAIQWSSSNSAVASLEYNNGTSASVMGHAAGTTTITATTASGLSVSYEMSVQEKAVLKVGETTLLTIPQDTYTKALFTPAETGTYIFEYPSNTYFGINCYDSNWNWPNGADWVSSDGTRRGLSYTLQGGTTYTLQVYNWNVQGNAELELTVTKAVPYTKLAFTQDSYIGYASNFQSTPVYIDYAPEYGGEELIITSSNTDVVDGGWVSGDCIYLNTIAVGTATVTIETADGRLSDTCTVTVKEPVTITSGKEQSITLDPGAHMIFKFVAPADETYSFYCADSDYFGFSVYDANGEWIETDDRWTSNALIADINAAAGETYYVSFHSSSDEKATYTVGIGKTTKATGLTIPAYEYTIYTDFYFYLAPDFTPVLAEAEDVTWTSSNENVAVFVQKCEYEGGYVDYEFYAVGAGTATITATSASGLKASCKITVVDPGKINVGKKSVTLSKWDTALYEFTAPEAGTYVIYDEDPDSMVGWYVSSENNSMQGYEDGNKKGIKVTLAAGDVVWPAVQNNTDETKTITFTIEQGVHEHAPVYVAAKDATYTTAGNIEHYACACGKIYADAAGTTELAEKDVIIPVLTPAASGECGDSLTWIMDDENTVIISGTGPMWDYDDPMMEEATKLNPWIELGIKKVVINEGATTIGASAFSCCESMTEVILPEGITSIGNAAFSFTAITAIDLPDTLTTLGSSVFNETELVSLAIPEGVTSVGGYLFTHTPTLTEVTLPSTLTTIPSYMFYGCSAKHIDIPEGVTAIGESAFESSGIESITLPSTLTEIGNAAFQSSALKNITIPGSVKTVGYCFYGSQLEEVVICEGVEEIVAWAFGTCSSLKKVTIPASVKTIGYRAFQHNADGAEYYFVGDAPECIIADNIIGDATNHFFDSVTGTAYYPVDNATWTEEVMAGFVSEDAEITWKSYGSHALELVPAKEATYGEPGNIEHYGCTKCDKVFADAEGATELTVEDVTIPQLIQVEDNKTEISKDVIDSVVEEVENGGEVKIPVADAGEVKSAAVSVESLTQIVEKEADLTLEMTTASVTIDSTALATVVEKAGADAVVTLEVEEIPEEDLTETQMAAIEELDKNLVATISAELLVNDQPIGSEADGGFGGGKVTVKIPVVLATDDFTVVYIADDGSVTVIENVTYENGVLTMELEHFSTYAIVQACLPGDTNDDGKITIVDLMRLANFFAGKDVELNTANADTNGDGKVTILDLMRLANYFAGKDVVLGKP